MDVLEPRHDLALNDEVDSNPELDPFLDHEFLKKRKYRKCTFALFVSERFFNFKVPRINNRFELTERMLNIQIINLSSAF